MCSKIISVERQGQDAIRSIKCGEYTQREQTWLGRTMTCTAYESSLVGLKDVVQANMCISQSIARGRTILPTSPFAL